MILNSFLNSAKALFKPASTISSASLVSVPQRSIVYRYIPKRSAFDKTNYVDYYVPPPVKYHRTRKPRLAQWDDPNVHWPPLMPRPTKLQGKELIRSIENKEKFVQSSLRPFKIPDVRTGDVIEFKYLFSLSESLGNILTGIVIGRKHKNTYNSSFRVLSRLAGDQFEMEFKEMSPLLAGVKILAKGSGNLRSKLYYLREKELARSQFMRPILKRAMKIRRDEIGKKKGKRTKSRKHIFETAKDPLYAD